MTQRENDFLSALQAGDTVLVHEYNRTIPVTVARRDKVKIVVLYNDRDYQFSAKSGYAFSGTRFGRKYLQEATPDELAKAQIAERRDEAHRRISRAKIDRLSLEALEAAADLLDPRTPEKAAVVPTHGPEDGA